MADTMLTRLASRQQLGQEILNLHTSTGLSAYQEYFSPSRLLDCTNLEPATNLESL